MSEPYAILRTEKVKTATGIRLRAGHNSRSIEPVNADPGGRIETLINPGGDPYQAVMERIEAAGAEVRRNSVLAQEILLGVSPAFFEQGDESLEWEWVNRSVEWLLDTYGDRAVAGHLHRDEITPHIHALVVPITDDGRLSARDMFNRKSLRNLQSDYAAALAELGVRRGTRGSKARHSRIHRFHGAAEKAALDYAVPPPPPMETEKQRREWAEAQTEALQPVFDLAEQARLEREKRLQYQGTAADLQDRLDRVEHLLREVATGRKPLSLVIDPTKEGTAFTSVVFNNEKGWE